MCIDGPLSASQVMILLDSRGSLEDEGRERRAAMATGNIRVFLFKQFFTWITYVIGPTCCHAFPFIFLEDRSEDEPPLTLLSLLILCAAVTLSVIKMWSA